MEPMPRQLWYFLIQGKQDESTGVFGNFYAYGEHCGVSLYHALKAAKENGIISPDAIETERLDNLESFQLPSDCIEINKEVLMRPTLYSFEVSEGEMQFIPPDGIIKTSEDGKHDYALIKECFVAYNKNENGIFEFELIVNKEHLNDIFFKAIDFLPTIDGFWIYVWNHWDEEKTELWAAKYFTNKKQILDFLESNKSSTLENGYIDCVVHSVMGETNLTLDEHKKIQLHTKDENVFKEFIRRIADLGYNQTKLFYNLEYEYYHLHYRPFGSLNRNDFISCLKEQRFELLDSWSESN
jgi:hypothetical protein